MAGTPATSAERIILNGRVATMDETRPFAEAVAIAGGRFLSVGDGREAPRFKGPATEVLDLRGATVIPDSTTRTRKRYGAASTSTSSCAGTACPR